jgi:hypothetical protein
MRTTASGANRTVGKLSATTDSHAQHGRHSDHFDRELREVAF